MTGMTLGATVLGAVTAAGLVFGQPMRAEPAPRSAMAIRAAHPEADGTSWRAHTTVLLATGPVTIDEEVVLADDGTLVRAYTSVRENGAETRTWYAPRESLVTTETRTGAQHSHVASDGLPWVYGPVRAAHGEMLGTPLAAWSTHRAAQHHSQVLRVAAEGSQIVSIDQLVVATGADESTVIVGDDAVDVDRDGIRSLHLHANETTLARSGSTVGEVVQFRAGA